jgi:hypothetical protein
MFIKDGADDDGGALRSLNGLRQAGPLERASEHDE